MDDHQGHGMFPPGQQATADKIRRMAPAQNDSNTEQAWRPPPRPFTVTLDNRDGEILHRYERDGKFEARLVVDGISFPSELDPGETHRAILPLRFPNVPAAGPALLELAAALTLLNNTLDRARDAEHDPLPDAATCHHTVRIERFTRHLPLQAVCDRCLTVLAADAQAWLEQHDYDPMLAEPDRRDTLAAMIEEAANRAR